MTCWPTSTGSGESGLVIARFGVLRRRVVGDRVERPPELVGGGDRHGRAAHGSRSGSGARGPWWRESARRRTCCPRWPCWTSRCRTRPCAPQPLVAPIDSRFAPPPPVMCVGMPSAAGGVALVVVGVAVEAGRHVVELQQPLERICALQVGVGPALAAVGVERVVPEGEPQRLRVCARGRSRATGTAASWGPSGCRSRS